MFFVLCVLGEDWTPREMWNKLLVPECLLCVLQKLRFGLFLFSRNACRHAGRSKKPLISRKAAELFWGVAWFHYSRLTGNSFSCQLKSISGSDEHDFAFILCHKGHHYRDKKEQEQMHKGNCSLVAFYCHPHVKIDLKKTNLYKWVTGL